MTDKYFKNYDAFYQMVLGATIMSNSQTDDFKSDATKIIDFIGKAYKLDDEFISDAQNVILNDLVRLGRTIDQLAVYGSREFGTPFTNTDALFDIKGDVLNTLQAIGVSKNQGGTTQSVAGVYINPNWFDYSHYKSYQAEVRFSKLALTSATGNLIATRQVGILLALGIGCERDLQEAIHRLTQCVVWGDIASMFYLAYAYKLAGNAQKESVYCALAGLCKKYLNAGYTVLPKAAEEGCDEEAKNLFIYIATIQQDVVIANNMVSIDFSFVEAILDESLDYFERMNYINNYNQKAWKEVTNSSRKPSEKLGFM